MRQPATTCWIKYSASSVLASRGGQGGGKPRPNDHLCGAQIIILGFYENRKTQKKTIDISQTLWHNKPRRSEMDEPNRRERLGNLLDSAEKSPIKLLTKREK